MRLERVVRSLESARIAAVAVAGDVSHAAVDAAQAAGLALFRLPEDAPLIQIERAVIRLIVDRSGYIAQRSSELQRELNQIASTVADSTRSFATYTPSPFCPSCCCEKMEPPSPMPGWRTWATPSCITCSQNCPTSSNCAVGQQPTRRSNRRRWRRFTAHWTTRQPSSFAEAVIAPVNAGESVRGYCLILRMGHACGHGIRSRSHRRHTRRATPPGVGQKTPSTSPKNACAPLSWTNCLPPKSRMNRP